MCRTSLGEAKKNLANGGENVNLQNFDEHINPAVVARGEEYYSDGHVIKLTRTAAGGCVAVVQGSREYLVHVDINSRGDIIYSQCTCPYDGGPYCKHEVAVFFALAGGMEEGDGGKASPQTKTALATALQRLTREDLLQIILEHAANEDSWAQELVCRFVADEDEVRVLREMLWSCVDTTRSISAAQVSRCIVPSVELVLAKARSHIETGRWERGIELCAMGLDFAVQDASDTGPDLADECIEVISEGIQSVVERKNPSEKTKLFDWIRACIQNYWQRKHEEVAVELLAIAAPLAAEPHIRSELLRIYDEARRAPKPQGKSSDYLAISLRRQQFALLTEHASDREADDFLQANLSDNQLRHEAVKRALNREDYPSVLQLTHAALTDESARWQTLWKTYMYEAYEKLGDTQNVRKMAEEFLFTKGFEWYPKVKAAYPPEEWPGVSARLKSHYEKEANHQSAYMKFLAAEGLLDEWLVWCRRSGPILEEYHSHLLPKHHDTVRRLLRAHIVGIAERATSRYSYQQVCEVVRKYKEAFAADDVAELIGHLKSAHKRKRAFMEELGKIK